MGMVERLEEEGLGVKEGDYWCGVLLYADDIVLLAESPEELQKIRSKNVTSSHTHGYTQTQSVLLQVINPIQHFVQNHIPTFLKS